MEFWAIVNLIVSISLLIMIKAPLVRAYLLINFFLMVNPAFLFIIFGIAHPAFNPDSNYYQDALIFVLAFNVVFGGTFMLLRRVLPRSRLALRLASNKTLNLSPQAPRLLFAILALTAIGLLGKFGLNTMGGLRMGETLTAAGSPFLELVKRLATFDLIALVLLGEFRLISKKPRPGLVMLFLALAGLSLILAFSTGSRSQVIVVLIVLALAFRDQIKRQWFASAPAILFLIPSIFFLFPLLGTMRTAGYDLDETMHRLSYQVDSSREVMADVLTTRLNYLEPVARAIEYVEMNEAAGGLVYWNNIVGLVPRLFWADKPQISNDSRDLGHLLDLVTVDDTSTSIGLQVIGEAYFEFGLIGLSVAAFQALIFAVIHTNFFVPRSPAAMTIYSNASLYILQRDGYFAIVPGLVWLAIGMFLFFAVFRFLRSINTSMS
jgi:hypothetical protein